jgi:hypothetical protein
MAKPMPLNDPGTGSDGRVHADDFTAQVHQRSAAVAGVDRGIDLDEVLVAELAVDDADAIAVQGADDAVGHRSDVAERAAEREDPVTLLQVIAVTPLGGDQPIGLDLHDGQVALRVGADELGLGDLAAVGKRHAHLAGAAGDVVVGQDVTGAAVHFHDDAAALAHRERAAVFVAVHVREYQAGRRRRDRGRSA